MIIRTPSNICAMSYVLFEYDTTQMSMYCPLLAVQYSSRTVLTHSLMGYCIDRLNMYSPLSLVVRHLFLIFAPNRNLFAVAIASAASKGS